MTVVSYMYSLAADLEGTHVHLVDHGALKQLIVQKEAERSSGV